MTKIGIIGFGNFGRFISKHLRENFEVFVSDVQDKTKEAEKIGVKFVEIKEAAANDIVLLAVPISSLKDVLEKIKKSLNKNSVVIDICSVKIMPCKWMKEILPSSIQVIGAHPLFGPQSGKNGIKGLKIVICPVRAKEQAIAEISKLFKNIGLEIILTTPLKHDKAMASSHALLHLIALPLARIGLKDQKIKISALDTALELVDIFKEDSLQLFQDIQVFNPESRKIRKKFLNEILTLDKELDNLKEVS